VSIRVEAASGRRLRVRLACAIRIETAAGFAPQARKEAPERAPEAFLGRLRAAHRRRKRGSGSLLLSGQRPRGCQDQEKRDDDVTERGTGHGDLLSERLQLGQHGRAGTSFIFQINLIFADSF
jgi:hypothetical protein